MTRGELVFMLERWIIANYDLMVSRGFTYPGIEISVMGVPADHSFIENINSLAYFGFIGGTSPFAPDEYVTRAEMSLLFLNILRRAPGAFDDNYFALLNVDEILGNYNDDSAIAAWAREAIAVMTDKGFLSGYEDGNFRPARRLLRSEAFSAVTNIDRWFTTGR